MANINFSSSELIKKGLSDTPFDQKVGKFITGAIVVGIIVAILYMAMPFLLPVFQGIQSIASMAVKTMIWVFIGFALFVIAKKQMRNLEYFSDYLARLVFRGIITYDPFLIQEKQIHQAEIDVEKMMTEKAVIDGKWTELDNKIKKYNQTFLEQQAGYEQLQQKAAKCTNEEDIKIINLAIQDSISAQASCQKYIKTISPIAGDMKYMSSFISEGYRILKMRIKGAKRDLDINKDIFESAQAGGKALERMKKAMVGDIELNNDAEKAQMEVMKNIALTVGQMKVSMEIIGDVTRQANLEEGSKIAYARKQLEALNLTNGQALPVDNTSANFSSMPTLQQQQVLKVHDSDF